LSLSQPHTTRSLTPDPAVAVTAPGLGFPDFREWCTGRIPSTALMPLKAPLPEPKYHDTPSPCKTYIGRPCPKKACKGHRVHFSRSGLCTSCWERAKKVTTMSEPTE
jgi:hypothetical protein